MTATFEPPASMSHSAETDPEPDHPRFRSHGVGFRCEATRTGCRGRTEDYSGITTLMLVAFGMKDIKSFKDLARCATDDLHGWIEDKSGNVTRHAGILDHFAVSCRECDAIILQARIKAG